MIEKTKNKKFLKTIMALPGKGTPLWILSVWQEITSRGSAARDRR